MFKTSLISLIRWGSPFTASKWFSAQLVLIKFQTFFFYQHCSNIQLGTFTSNIFFRNLLHSLSKDYHRVQFLSRPLIGPEVTWISYQASHWSSLAPPPPTAPPLKNKSWTPPPKKHFFLPQIELNLDPQYFSWTNSKKRFESQKI